MPQKILTVMLTTIVGFGWLIFDLSYSNFFFVCGAKKLDRLDLHRKKRSSAIFLPP